MYALAFFGMNDLREIGQMTLKEYNLRKKAYLLKRVQIDEDLHLQAFLNRNVKATTSDGKKYKYLKFKDFFDKDKRLEQLIKKEGARVSERLLKIAKRMKEYNAKTNE